MTNKQDSLYSDLMNDWPLIEIGDGFVSFTPHVPSPITQKKELYDNSSSFNAYRQLNYI